MAKRGFRWSATAMPAARNALIRTSAAEAARADHLAGRARAAGRADFAEQFDRAAARHRDTAARLPAAGLFWVAAPMVPVAMDAAGDVPGLRAEDAPTPTGLMGFAEPLPPYPVDAVGGLALRDGARTDVPHTDPVRVDALAWTVNGDGIKVRLLCLGSRLPLPMTPNDGPLIEFLDITAPLPALLGEPVPALGDNGVKPASHGRGVLSLLSATWVLMRTPTVAERRDVDARWGAEPTGRTRPGDLVSLVGLRPLRREPGPDGPGSGRRLTSRHVVRGHWTHQPYGPGRSLRRLQWVPPYTRGPDGAPLTQREQVMVWRR